MELRTGGGGGRIDGSSVPADTGIFRAAVVQDAMERYHPVPEAQPLSPAGNGVSTGAQTLQATVKYLTHGRLVSSSVLQAPYLLIHFKDGTIVCTGLNSAFTEDLPSCLPVPLPSFCHCGCFQLSFHQDNPDLFVKRKTPLPQVQATIPCISL